MVSEIAHLYFIVLDIPRAKPGTSASIQYMLVYWREVSVVVSMNSPKAPLHIFLLWNSDGRLADQTNALRIWFLTWYSSPTYFYSLSLVDKL